MKQVPSQCPGCVKPNYQCRIGKITCPAGYRFPSWEQAAQCESISTQSIAAECMPSANDANGGNCPSINAGQQKVELCAPGLPLAGTGSDGRECDVCFNVTLTPSCDVDEAGNNRPNYARSVTTCANLVGTSPSPSSPRMFRCTPGQVIDFPALGCTASNLFDPTGGELMWWWNGAWKSIDATTGNTVNVNVPGVSLGQTRPKRVNCTDFLNNNWCVYTVLALPNNGCTSINGIYNGAQVRFMIGSTTNTKARPLVVNPGANPAGCPIPYVP